MMSPDKNFNMKKPYKNLIALCGRDKNYRAALKNAFIDAQLCEEAARRQALKSKDTRNKEAARDSE